MVIYRRYRMDRCITGQVTLEIDEMIKCGLKILSITSTVEREKMYPTGLGSPGQDTNIITHHVFAFTDESKNIEKFEEFENHYHAELKGGGF